MTISTAAGELAIEENLKQFLLVLSVSLSVATLPRIFSWLRQVPYTLLLVIVGLGLALADVRLVSLSPGLILLIFLPPILFEAAWNLQWSDLRRELVPVWLYAVGGVIISITITALGLRLVGIPLITTLLVGACLAATDSASVIGLFRELGAGRRLTTLMEGESLFNDGASIVAFGFLVELASDSEWHSTALLRFFTVVGIGVGLGSLIGFGLSYLTRRLDLPLVEQSLTLVSAYGTYLLVEELGGSGVIGVVTVGLILGNLSRTDKNSRTQLVVTEFWEFLAFFVNSIVFLLIGDQIYLPRLTQNLATTTVTIGAIVLARAIAIYGLGCLSNWLANTQICLRDQTVLWWGGLRGSVSIALALSIPANLSGREEIIANVFGTVLFTLLVQGLTTKFLLKKLGLVDNQLQQKYLAATARRVALNRVLQHLNQVDIPGIQAETYRYQTTLVREQLSRLEVEIDQLHNQYPQLQDVLIQQLQAELLTIESDTYAELIRTGWLNHEPSPLLQKVFQDQDKPIV
jgi:CPA1 family monovalent cation:H+ antiporter